MKVWGWQLTGCIGPSIDATSSRGRLWQIGLRFAKNSIYEGFVLVMDRGSFTIGTIGRIKRAWREATLLRAEATLKAAIIDRLLAKGEVRSDDVLISEMVVDKWSRRADLVLANGKLTAFEIKSDFDSLTRLPGQLETFQAMFAKVILVVVPRFAEKVEAIAPESVGIWVVEGDGPDGIKVKRAGRTEQLSVDAALSLMTVSDLRLLLASNGVEGVSHAARQELENLARQLTKKDLAEAARCAVKRRYRSHHTRFMKSREKKGTHWALQCLKRPQRRVERSDDSSRSSIALPEVLVSTDHPAFVLAPAGPILKRLRA